MGQRGNPEEKRLKTGDCLSLLGGGGRSRNQTGISKAVMGKGTESCSKKEEGDPKKKKKKKRRSPVGAQEHRRGGRRHQEGRVERRTKGVIPFGEQGGEWEKPSWLRTGNRRDSREKGYPRMEEDWNSGGPAVGGGSIWEN